MPRKQAIDRRSGMSDDPQAEWPLWEVFVRSKAGLDHKHCGSLHARRPGDGDPAGARRLHAAPGRHQRLGRALATRSSPATRPTRRCTSIRWKTRSIATPPSTSCPSPWTTCEARRDASLDRSSTTPAVQYLLRIGDTCLILAQRLASGAAMRRCSRKTSPGEHGARPDRPGARLLTHAGAARRARARRGPARLPARRARLPQRRRWSSCRVATSPSPCCATRWSSTC